MTFARTARRLVLAGLAIVALGTPAATATPVNPATAQSHRDRVCARQFDRAVDRYVQTTDERDAAGFNALLHPDAVVIFANGGIISGKPAIADFIRDFFADPGWTQTFAELERHVVGCQSGTVLFDSVYSVPAENRVSPLVIGVTFTYRHGRWLVLHNQDSDGPASR